MEDEEDEERLLQLSIGTGLSPSHFLHSPHSAFPPRFCLTRMWHGFAPPTRCFLDTLHSPHVQCETKCIGEATRGGGGG